MVGDFGLARRQPHCKLLDGRRKWRCPSKEGNGLLQLNGGCKSKKMKSGSVEEYLGSRCVEWDDVETENVKKDENVLSLFRNRRHAQRSKNAKMAVKLNFASSPSDESYTKRAATHSFVAPSGSGRRAPDNPKMEFEAKSARDRAWYDVVAFLTHRMLESDDLKVQVRFVGFGAEEDEWVNVRICVRRLSLPCEVFECVAILPGDLILCF
eukprot:Gb_03638 [translate_table: standard]